MIRLTREQTEAAEQHPDGVRCEGEGSPKTFILVEEHVMKRALYRQDVLESVATGIAEMEAGLTMSIDEAEQRGRTELGFPPRAAS